MADFWDHDEPAAGDGEVDRAGDRASERRSFDRYHQNLDEAEVIARLRSVRDQLADAGPVAYNALIRLIDRYTGDSQVDTDDVMGAATAVPDGTRYVKGGAIEDLRAAMGAGGSS
jgi:hypothetical protein